MNMIHNTLETPQPDSGRSGRKRVQKQTAILDAALELIAEEGLEGLTMQKLAKRLDYAVGALYRYFDSKESLLAALQIRSLAAYDRLYQQAESRLEAEIPARPLVLLGICAELFAASRTAVPALYALIAEATAARQNLLVGDLARQVFLAALPLMQRFSGWLEQAAASGALQPGDTSTRAILFWTSVQGLVQVAKLDRHVPGLFGPGLLTALLHTLLLGWGAEPELCETVAVSVEQFKRQPGLDELFTNTEKETQTHE